MVLGMAPYVGLSASFLSPPMCTAATADWCWTAESIWILRLATGVLLGLGAPILWTGQGVYLARLAAHEANAGPNIDDAERAERLSQAIKRFNGAFFSAFQFSGCGGRSQSVRRPHRHGRFRGDPGPEAGGRPGLPTDARKPATRPE